VAAVGALVAIAGLRAGSGRAPAGDVAMLPD